MKKSPYPVSTAEYLDYDGAGEWSLEEGRCPGAKRNNAQKKGGIGQPIHQPTLGNSLSSGTNQPDPLTGERKAVVALAESPKHKSDT